MLSVQSQIRHFLYHLKKETCFCGALCAMCDASKLCKTAYVTIATLGHDEHKDWRYSCTDSRAGLGVTSAGESRYRDSRAGRGAGRQFHAKLGRKKAEVAESIQPPSPPQPNN